MTEKDKKEIKGYMKKLSDDFGKRIGVLTEEFQHRVSAIGEQYGDIKKTLDSHSGQVANLTMDMMEVKSDVRQIKLDIKLNLNDKVDKKHFVDLEGRVRVLEKK